MSKQLETYTSLPEETKQFVLALSIVVDRIGKLPEADRDDMFELLLEWRKVGDQESRASIQRAMEEILAQTPISTKPMPLDPGPQRFVALEKWSESVASRLRRFREESGMTQADLALKTGLPQSHISRLESAAHSATFKTLEKLAAALNVEVRELDPCAE